MSLPYFLDAVVVAIFQDHRTEQLCRLKTVVRRSIGTGALGRNRTSWGGSRTSFREFLWLKWVKSVKVFTFLCVCASSLLGVLFIYQHTCRAI